MEALLKAINTKVQFLEIKTSKSKEIIEKRNIETIERHRDNLKLLSKEVNELKIKIEQEKLLEDESVEDVSKCSGEIESKLEMFDADIAHLGKCIKETEHHASLATKESKEALLAKERQQQLDFERAQLELKFEYDKKAEEFKKKTSRETSKTPSAKLPKLSITKFDGSYEQWLPFWNKYVAEIDSTDLAPVTKFAYLKELLVAKVRSDIDGLPFTTEGYERAKNILESEYGKVSEIVHAYVNNIMGLPTVTGTNAKKIDEFYKTLQYNVQSLETLGKLKDVAGNVRAVLDKLKGIKADLVRGHESWQDWNFAQLLQALKRWKDVNPVEESEISKPAHQSRRHDGYQPPRVKSYQTQQQSVRGCVYCESTEHKSSNCQKCTTVDARKQILASKRLCFNCTGPKHRAAECKSRSGCLTCGQRHHTSICNNVSTDGLLLASQPESNNKVIYPVVVVEVEGVQCRALLDTGAGSSYASAALLDLMKSRPHQTQVRTIEMMLGVQTKRVELFSLKVESLKKDFSLEVEVTRVEKQKLLEVDNPGYSEILRRYPHLQGVEMNDKDTKSKLPVHLILGASEYAKIKRKCAPRLGSPGEPVAELTSFGWTILSPGEETEISKVLLTQTSQTDYEALCNLDVLGLEDPHAGDQATVYTEFKEQLKRSPEGWYETGLPWKGDRPTLPNNKAGSLRRLNNLLRKLEKSEMTEKYNNVIHTQLQDGIVERATDPPVGPEFYIPHKAVVRESAESTKLRVVYDASARAFDQAPSLNDCLHTGPPLQNQLWAVLVRARFHPVAITGDIKQAFLQVRIREEDRDALRFHWIADLESKRVETLRFSRALFGLGPSPFLLGGVVQQHLESCRKEYKEMVEEIERSLYVDDLISGGSTVEDARKVKLVSTEIFSQAAFELHKWHSNAAELEPSSDASEEELETFAKEQLGVPRLGETTLLGLAWNKSSDTIQIKFPSEKAQLTKRGILRKVAKVYDPLGLVSPTTLGGKLLYREVCELKIAWDRPLPEQVTKRWSKWESNLPRRVAAPRSIPKHREQITTITLHCFGDASGKGVSAALYAVVSQPSGVEVGLVTAKARLAKLGLSIPRLELVSAHMATNLIVNARNALEGFPVGELHCWLDSTVALHWIRGAGEYKQFVSNRVQKIKVHEEVQWHHVGTKENPADLGSRSGSVEESKLWWKGPEWLANRDCWPPDITTSSTTETRAEAKVVRELFAAAVVKSADEIVGLLTKFNLWKTLRICGWIWRFVHNLRLPKKQRTKGLLTTEEINETRAFWERLAQGSSTGTEQFEEDRLQLNLQANAKGVLECRGRIQGHFPVYIPDCHLYASKLVEDAHCRTLHGGVSMTMAKVREHHWIPRLRRLVKKTVKECYGCKRFRVKAFDSPPPGNLPRDRTEGRAAFKVVGVDYAGPLKYQKTKKVDGKAYLILYACSLTRALYLELLPNMETTEFLRSLKRFIARRGRPEKIYSDNGRTFVGAANWMKLVTERISSASQNKVAVQLEPGPLVGWTI